MKIDEPEDERKNESAILNLHGEPRGNSIAEIQPTADRRYLLAVFCSLSVFLIHDRGAFYFTKIEKRKKYKIGSGKILI